MQLIDTFQYYANHRWGRIVALGLGVLFSLLVLLQLINGIEFIFSGNSTSTQFAAITNQQTSMIDLSQLNIFGVYQAATINPNALPKATINLQLNGVFVAVPERFSQAVLSEPGGAQIVYYEGDTLPGNAKLYRILPNSVIIQYNGQLQRLSLPEATLQLGERPSSLDLPENSAR